MNISKNMIGQRFGRLIIVSQYVDSKQERTFVSCKCDCGKIKNNIRLSHLKDGTTSSCGCYKKDILKKNNEFVFYENETVGIVLTNSKFEAIIDLDEYNKVKKYCWRLNRWGYCVTGSGECLLSIHSLILGNKDGFVIDHIDRNKLNNLKNNLRHVTPRDNSINRSLGSNTPHDYLGVYFQKNKWIARIKVHGNQIDLGRFNRKIDAIIARLRAEKEYFGEFAPQRHLFEEYGI